MKKRSRCFLYFFALWLAAVPVINAYGTSADIDAAKKRATTLEEEKNKVEEALKELETLKSDTERYVRQLDHNLAELGKELEELGRQIEGKELEITAAQEELEEAKAVEREQYEAMKLRIQYMYENSNTSYLDMILESENMTQLLKRSEYMSEIVTYDRQMLDVYADAKELVQEKEGRLQNEKQELLSLQESTQAKQDSVEKLIEDKNKELNRVESRMASAQSQIDSYEKDIKAQEAKIEQIEAEMKRKEEEARRAALAAGQTYNTTNIGNIKFIWPCPASTRITSRFGGREAPMEGASSNHKGLDIGAPTGTDIVAAASGEVAIATYSYSSGNYIMINHGGGVYTVYMHCSQLLASAGDKVSQGQVIAKVGSTGYSTGPHLHFGVRVSGSYVDPQRYVSP